MFRKLCGDAALKNVVLVTNMWSEVSLEIGKAREYELYTSFFKLATLKGAKMYRHHNTIQSAYDIVRSIMENHPIVLQIQRELVDERKGITEMAAGASINQELEEQTKRHETELKDVLEKVQQASKDKDKETRQELEEETRRLVERIEEISQDSKLMATRYIAEKARMEVRVKEMEEEARKRERDEAERRLRLADHNRRLQANQPLVDRTTVEQAIGRQQDQLDSGSWVMVPVHM